MVLSDQDIAHEIESANIEIQPYKQDNLQPASYDVALGDEVLIFRASGTPIDVVSLNYATAQKINIADHPFEIGPGRFILGCTLEYLVLPII